MTETASTDPESEASITGLVAIFSASNFIIGMGAFVVIGLLEPLAADLDVTPARAGALMTVYALAYAVMSPVLVAVTGQLGRRRVMFWALSLFTLAAALSAIAPTEMTIWGARVLAAAGAGLFTPVAAAVAAGLSPPERRARVLAAVFFGLTLAQVVGVPAGSFLAYEFGWRLAFGLVALLALPCLWLIWTRVPAGLRFQPVALKDLSDVLVRGPLVLAVSFTAVFLGGIYVVYTYFAPLLSGTMGFDGPLISLMLLVFGVGAVVGNIMGGFLADRIGPERTLAALAVAQAVLLVNFSFLPFPTPVVFAFVFVWSVCGWSFMAAQQARLVARAPEVAPVTLSLNAAAIYAGAAFGSAVGGFALAAGGQGALGITGAAIALLALGTLYLAREKT